MAGPIFSYLRNPYPSISGRLDLDPFGPPTPYQWFRAQGGDRHPTSLGFSVSQLPGFDHYRKYKSSFLYQQTRGDPFPNLVASNSRSLYVAPNLRHGSQSQTHTRLFECDSGPPIQTQSADINRVKSPFQIVKRIFKFWGTTAVDMFATVHNTRLPQLMSHIPESLALAVDALVSWLAGEIDVHVSAVSSAQKLRHSETTCHPGSRSDTNAWWPPQPWFPTLTSTLCGSPSVFPYRRDLVSQQGQKFTSDGSSYHLHAWRLSCNIKRQDFWTRCLDLPQHLGDPQPIACMMTGGFASLTGPQGKDLILSVPQLLK